MLIDIVSDTVCPWCFIGKRRLERALSLRPDLSVQIYWHPFQLNPDMPQDGMDRQEYLARKFGGEQRARQIYRTVSAAGEEEGIAFQFEEIRRTPNTLASHRLIRWAGSAGVQGQVVELLFRSYFEDGLDIGSADILMQVAAEAGMDPLLVRKLLDEGADLELVRSEDRTARDMGISGVPCFIIDRKYALSGAQDPAVFLQVFEVATRDHENTAPADASF